MADEGSRGILTELILEQKELEAKIADVDRRLEVPMQRLVKAKEIYDKAKAAVAASIEEVRPLKSERTLLEGELELVEDKKREARMQARRIEAGGIRPGTAELVEHMNELAGDPGEWKLRQQAKELSVDAALADLKSGLGGDDD